MSKWIKTMSENQLIDPFMMPGGTYTANPIVMSGDGTVFYVTVGDFSAIARYKFENNVWTHENFISTPNPSIPATKYLPNSIYCLPIATSFDGSTLVSIKGGNSMHSIPRKVLVTSYVNGEFVQVGSEITFVPQSNFNTPTGGRQYYIQKVSMSADGLKMVIFTQAGMNTLVFSNGSWNLLPSSSDILPSHFIYGDYGEVIFAVSMSKNGMYLTLLSYANNAVLVFKFNNQLNNWGLFKTISDNAFKSPSGGLSVAQTYISDDGNVFLVLDEQSKLSRFEYSLTTNNYEFITRNETTNTWNPSICFASSDCNTFLCRYREPGVQQHQYFRMLKWNNGSWELTVFPSSIVPIMNTDGGTFAKLLNMSSDGKIFLTTSLSSDSPTFNVYYDKPAPDLPTLHLGDMVKIKATDVSFNDANVFVKNPTVALNVANKQYVDIADAEINALILSNTNNDNTSTIEYYDLVEERQTVQSTLATQIENLYQYFFNTSRTNANII